MPSRPRRRFDVYKTRHLDVLQTIKRRHVIIVPDEVVS